MTRLFAGYSKGQIKIQQMAFVLVAIMIFFGMVALFYFSVKIRSLEGSAESLRESEVIENVRKMSGTAEFTWTSEEDCPACIDVDKVFMLKQNRAYDSFWEFPLIQIQQIYPNKTGECNVQNYPDCGTITLVDKNVDFVAHSAFVALCRHEAEGYRKCTIGKIIMGFKTV